MNGSRFSRTRWTNDGDIRPRLDSEGEIAKDADPGTGGVAEVDTLEANASNNLLGDDTLIRVGVDIGFRIQKLDNVDGGTTGRRDIRDEGENIPCLNGAECGALITYNSVKN